MSTASLKPGLNLRTNRSLEVEVCPVHLPPKAILEDAKTNLTGQIQLKGLKRGSGHEV
jgi:hypothetical protein